MSLNEKNLVQDKNILEIPAPPKKEKLRFLFYKEMKITIILATILGMMPISRDKTGKPTFKWLSGITIYSLIIFDTVSVTAWFSLKFYIRVITDFHDKMVFDDKIIYYEAILIHLIHFIPLISLFECKKKAEYLVNWKTFEEKYYKITKKPLNYKMKRSQCIFFFAFLLVSTFLINFMMMGMNILDKKYYLKTTLNDKILVGITTSYYLLIVGSCLAYWIFLTSAIRKTAKILLNDLKDSKLRLYLFDELYGLWLDLKYLTDDLGNAFSFTYIYYLCYIFMLLMASTYSFLANLINFNRKSKYELGAYAFITVVPFVMIADCAHRTIKQLKDDFNYELLKILAKERNPKRIRGIKWFIQTLTLNPPVISLSGYASLDRGFNVLMLGTLITYIVVVLQFRS